MLSKRVSFFESLVWLDRKLNPSFPGYWRTRYPMGRDYLNINKNLFCKTNNWSLRYQSFPYIFMMFFFCLFFFIFFFVLLSIENSHSVRTYVTAIRHNGFFYCAIDFIIMSCRRHGYPWPSLATSPYRSSPRVGLQGHIPYHHIAAECMFELVVLLLPGHMWGSIVVHHLWARPCFSSSVQHFWFV